MYLWKPLFHCGWQTESLDTLFLHFQNIPLFLCLFLLNVNVTVDLWAIFSLWWRHVLLVRVHVVLLELSVPSLDLLWLFKKILIKIITGNNLNYLSPPLCLVWSRVNRKVKNARLYVEPFWGIWLQGFFCEWKLRTLCWGKVIWFGRFSEGLKTNIREMIFFFIWLNCKIRCFLFAFITTLINGQVQCEPFRMVSLFKLISWTVLTISIFFVKDGWKVIFDLPFAQHSNGRTGMWRVRNID